MKYNYTNSFILNSLDLPDIKTLDDLANCLSLSKTIIYLLSKKNYKYYKRFYKKKENGETREILSPSYSMKLVQRWILENVLYKLKVSDVATAYKKKFRECAY
ncbi:hypothetical protein [Caloranaerobacter sp. DY30410]|uniref:hypothetical protein n=1 Tax=Caloranaerobacter sp. DY30410 TaxID=3238305 RepID=UPI003D064BE4